MKNSIFNAVCKTRYLALLVVLIFTCGNAWGTDVTFTVNVESSSTTTMSKGDVTVSTTSGTFSRTDNYRIYANNSMTITSSGGNITQVAFNITQNTFTANVGTWTDNTKTWTGDASSVTFSASGGQVRITSFTVTINSSVSCTECTYYVYNGSTWVSIGTTGFTDVVLAPPTLPDNNHGAGNGCWTTDKNVFTSCTYYASGDKFRYVPNPGGAAPTSVNKPGSGTCELYAVYAQTNGCLSTTVTSVQCARIWDEPEPNTPSVSGSSVTLSWSSVTGASGYHLYVTDGDSYEHEEDVNGTSKTLSGLAAGTYMWTVAANSSDNDACDSNPADGDDFEIVGCTDISSSTVSSANISVTPAKTSAAISWNAVANASSYEVKVYAGATATGSPVFTASPDPTSTSCTATGLTANTQYTVAIKAKNACSTSSTAGTKTFTTLNLTLYTVTFVNSAGSAPSPLSQTSENQALSIPQPAACEDWTFAGWKVGGSQSSTTSDPTGSGTWITSNSWPKSYTPTGNITVYAVFKQTTGGGSGASAGTTLWSEDFSGYSANDVPNETISSSDTHTGTTVYSGSVTYACTNGTNGTTKIYNENTAGGTAPELMVSKYSGTFAITGIPKAGASVVTVYFTTNNQNMTVASSATGYTGSYNQKASGEHSFDITCGTASTFDLTFTGPSGNNNIRLDDIQVKVKTAGASGMTTWTSSPDCATSKELTSITIDTDPTRLNYVTGEFFDPTGAVVTAHYDDLSTETVTGSTSWDPETALTEGTSKTATASYTEGGVTKTATVTYNVYTPTLAKKDETGTTIDLVSPAISRTAAVVTADATGNSYQFKEWQITGGTFSGGVTTTSDNPATITSVSGAVTVTAVYYKPVTVTWYVSGNGSSNIYHTDTHACGWSLMYPSNPDPTDYSCDGKVFVGWTSTFPYNNASIAPTFVSSGTTINSDQSYYAVFAEQTTAGTPPTWTKTAFGSVSAGTYLMCTADGHVFNGEISSGRGQITAAAFTSFAGNSTFNVDAPVGSCELTFAAVTNGFSMYAAGKGYLFCSESTASHIGWHESETSYWYNYTSHWRYYGARDGSGSATAIVGYSNSDFRNYVSPGSSTAAVVFLKKTAAGVPATYSNYTTSCACEGFSFHTGTGTDNEVKATNTRTCFVREGSSTTWKIENYTIPADAKFFVGWQDEFKSSGLGTSSRSSVQTWAAEMYLENTKTDASTRPTTGPATGAVGTLSIWSDNNWNNCHVGFQPNGYGITYGGSAHAFATTATANKRETEVVTLTNVSQTYNIGLATNTAGTYVKCGNSKETDEALSAMGVTEIVGGQKKILFRPQQYTNDNAKIGLYNVTAGSWVGFMSDDDGDGIYEGFVPTSCTTIIFARHNSSAASPSWDNKYNQTVNIGLPTNGLQVIYTFENDWDNKDGEGKHYVSNAAAHPANGQNGKFRMWDNSTDQNWFVHFIPYFHLTYDGNGGGDAVTNLPASPADVCSEESDANRTVTVANTDPVRSGYRFMGWADTQAHATAGTVDHAKNTTIVLTGDKTIYAVWKQVYTVTYDYAGGSGSCSNGSYIEGETVTVCASTPTKTASTFNGWSYSPSVTVTAGQFSMPASNVVITATWVEASYALNHSGSNYTNTEGKTTIKSSDTPLTLNYTCAGTYAFPLSISIAGGGKASWIAETDYTWTVGADKQSAQLVIASTSISADVTITITMKTRYTVVWDEHGITTTEYYASDDNTVAEKTGIADCGEKKFYWWTEDAEFVSDDDTPPANATFGTISGNKYYYAIYADATVPQNPGYTKVTTISAGTYLIAGTNSGTSKAYAGQNGTGNTATGSVTDVTITNDVISSKGSAVEVTVSLGTGGDAGYFAIQTGSAYMKGYNDNKLVVQNDIIYDWSLTNTGRIQSKSQNTRYIELRSGTPDRICTYAGSQNPCYLFKKQTTTYSNYSKTCATYDITIDAEITGGTVTTTPAAGTDVAGEGQEITVNVTPGSCKYLSALVYNDGSDHAISIASTPYTFTMPASDVTVTATFSDKTVSSIAPNTSEHRVLMQGSAFVGEQIRVTYNSGETEDLAWNNSALAFSGYNMATIGNYTVTVNYTGTCGNASTSYSMEVSDGIPVTFSDCGITTVRKYEPGDVVPVETTAGEYACAGWEFDGWSETPVVHGSTNGYTKVFNFTASSAKTLYAVYISTENTYVSIDDDDELLPGCHYAIMRQYSYNNLMMLKAQAGTGSNAGYLVAFNEYDAALSYSSPDYTLTSSEEKYSWQLHGSSGNWVLYNKNTNKYLDLSTAGNAEIESAISDTYTITQDAYDDHLFTIRSNTNTTYYLTYNSSYYKSYTSAQKCDFLRRSMQFSSNPPCAPRSVIFHGNGGVVTGYGGSPTGADVTITEASRDAGIKLPTATYSIDCNGKTWSFIGWSSSSIDVTRVPVLTTDLLEDGVVNADYSITSDNEEYWAVYSNTGAAETKFGTITFTKSDFNKNYVNTERTTTKSVAEVGDYTFGYVDVGWASDLGIQFENALGELYNKTSLGKVTSISFTNFHVGTIDNLKIYVGDAEKSTTYQLTAADLKVVGNVYTYYPKQNCGYVYIKDYNAYINVDNITINFGQGTVVYATTPDCSVITLSGDVKVTSTSGQSMKSLTPIAIFGNELAADKPVTLKAYNVSDDTENTHFSFGTITKDGSSIPNQNIAVTYNPAGETTDGIENVYFKAVVGDVESNRLAGAGRHLPTKFIIAQKVGDDWFALPNDMGNNYTSSTTGVKLSAVNEATGVATIYSDVTDQFAYQLLRSKALDNAGMVFSSPAKSNNIIKANTTASTSTIGLYAQSGWNNGANPTAPYFEFTPATSDLVDYTLKNTFQDNYLGITSNSWGIGASSTVRFFSIDQQPAPTITWENDMLGSTHATNKAENGVVTLPTGADPVSCNTTLLPTFCGWKDGQIATYAAMEPTYVQAGDAATTDKTYYAVFKHATLNRWYTQCPTYYTITYTANGGVGDDHYEYTLNTTADAITVEAAGFTKEGCTFVGWTNPSDDDGAIITPGAGKITGLSGDITLNAVWIGTTTVTGTVRLTASAGEMVATGTTDITISSTNFACATKLRFKYKDVTNDVTYGRSGSPLYSASEFRLCNASYNVADVTPIDISAVTGAYNQTFSITYEPKGGANTLDHYQLIVEVLLKNTVIETKTLDLYGRTLPEHFAIATKIGGSWYALPNNMASAGTYDPVLISVTEDASVLNWTAQGPATVGYTMKDYTVNYSKLRFAADDANGYCLWASTGNSAEIRNWSNSSTDSGYGWTVTETNADFSTYTLDNKSNNTRDALKVYNNKWTMYNSGGYSKIHFIPLTTVETIDIIAREWKTNGLIYSINDGNATTAATYKVGNVSETSATLTKISTGGYGLYEVGVCDLSSHYGEVLTLKLTIGGNTKYAYVNVPIIVDEDDVLTTAGSVPFTTIDNTSADYDVVILGGGKLTMDATASHASKFHNVYVYPDATLVNANGSTDLNYLELRAGIPSYSNLNGDLKVPHVYMSKGFTSCTNGANLDMYIDVRHDYALSVPFAVSLANVKYANALNANTGAAINGTLNSHFRVSYYSAEQRATTGKGWVDISSTSTILSPGTGYVIQAKRPSGQPLAVLRFPFTANPTGWADASGETEKGAISISGYGADNVNISDNNKGWNLIANPYSANISYYEQDESSFVANFTIGWLDEEYKDGKWTGKYEYKEKTNAYVTIPNDNYTVYTQKRANASDVVYQPFKNFFIQASSNTGTESVTFDRSYRQQAPAIMRTAAQITNPFYVDVDLVHGSNVVTAGLTIDPDATPGYKFGEDQNIFENRSELNYLKVYTVEDGHYLVGNTLTPDELSKLIPIEFYAPDNANGYVFTLNEASDIDNLESLILFDSQSGTATNLLQDDYPFTVDVAGLIENRFTINVTLKKENNTATDMDEIDEADKLLKFIYQDKMYILREGVIYDATGKRVREINK